MRKKILKTEAGVRLERIEHLSATGAAQQAQYDISSRRTQAAKRVMDEREALDAFDLEVIATLSDPVASKLIDQAE